MATQVPKTVGGNQLYMAYACYYVLWWKKLAFSSACWDANRNVTNAALRNLMQFSFIISAPSKSILGLWFSIENLKNRYSVFTFQFVSSQLKEVWYCRHANVCMNYHCVLQKQCLDLNTVGRDQEWSITPTSCMPMPRSFFFGSSVSIRRWTYVRYCRSATAQ